MSYWYHSWWIPERSLWILCPEAMWFMRLKHSITFHFQRALEQSPVCQWLHISGYGIPSSYSWELQVVRQGEPGRPKPLRGVSSSREGKCNHQPKKWSSKNPSGQAPGGIISIPLSSQHITMTWEGPTHLSALHLLFIWLLEQMILRSLPAPKSDDTLWFLLKLPLSSHHQADKVL